MGAQPTSDEKESDDKKSISPTPAPTPVAAAAAAPQHQHRGPPTGIAGRIPAWFSPEGFLSVMAAGTAAGNPQFQDATSLGGICGS